MPPTTVDAPTLYQKVGHLLQQGMRTSTYKLATLSALIDFCVSQQLSPNNTLEVPLEDLARRVFAMYWPQTEPFREIRLRQSTQAASRIFDSIESVRTASRSHPNTALPEAIERAPQIYRRAIDNVALVLAQHPLPRLQRVPGAARSLNLLFDDSFLHDNVTRHDLTKHNNAIKLHVGIAAGLSELRPRLQPLIRSIWVDDVIRFNKLMPDLREPVANHLFGAHSGDMVQRPLAGQAEPPSSQNSSLPAREGLPTTAVVQSHEQCTTGVRDWGLVVGAGLREIAALCEIRPDGCWVAPSNGPVRCRHLMDASNPIDLPRIPLHRWAWMVDNGRSHQAVPPHLLQIHRSCNVTTCCNPEHLYPAAPGGTELTQQQVDSILDRSSPNSTRALKIHEGAGERTAFSAKTTVLTENLSELAELCTISASGCWISPTTSALPCRLSGDERPVEELPRFTTHRWAWKVANECARRPLPGSQFQVWKRCSTRRCCNPDHLYLTDQQGTEYTAAEAEKELARYAHATGLKAVSRDALRIGEPPSTSGRHRAPDIGDNPPPIGHREPMAEPQAMVVADRLNKLIDTRSELGPDANAQIAASLQEDGLAVSEGVIARLRTGSGPLPNIGTIEAIAYYFNVETAYFLSGHTADTPPPHSQASNLTNSHVREGREEDVDHPLELKAQHVDRAALGQVIRHISESIMECLGADRPDLERARRLASWIGDLSTSIDSASDTTSLSLSLVRRIIEESGPGHGTLRISKSSAPTSEQPAPARPTSHRLPERTSKQSTSPQKSEGDWTRQTFIDSVHDQSDRAFLLRILELLDANFNLPPLGSRAPLHFGTRPYGAVFVYPFGLRHPPFRLGINSEGQLTIRGCWRGFPKVTGHFGFGDLARLLGQDELGPAQNVPVKGLDAEEVWNVAVKVARAINR
ncbi:hypothetical protein V4U86_19105 [Mycobacterium sp. AMU20-3851]|uniref:hypothetical protein n=1 Tax=Mycobacterium sp. AMU20-3851 TaxID=3122055 RepID=UPI00375429AC